MLVIMLDMKELNDLLVHLMLLGVRSYSSSQMRFKPIKDLLRLPLKPQVANFQDSVS
ncbi:hypothetical protein HanRHA438_Chr08g0369051 [Helianthus annuus]|nr:hypothetical protein HanRHA438_Chr08g0369051 [Helianthus annuus]